ncbi:MAG: hypothetical protein OWU33_00385 [Firmicutes bacterium]|nr:hypothetical protein [Bacillota bacterium]
MNRITTRFAMVEACEKAIQKLERSDYIKILMTMKRFEEEWKKSVSDADIASGFDLQNLEHRKGAYRVAEIRAGRNWRIGMMIFNDVSRIYWLHIWRKTAPRNRQDYDIVKDRAHRIWNQGD